MANFRRSMTRDFRITVASVPSAIRMSLQLPDNRAIREYDLRVEDLSRPELCIWTRRRVTRRRDVASLLEVYVADPPTEIPCELPDPPIRRDEPSELRLGKLASRADVANLRRERFRW